MKQLLKENKHALGFILHRAIDLVLQMLTADVQYFLGTLYKQSLSYLVIDSLK